MNCRLSKRRTGVGVETVPLNPEDVPVAVARVELPPPPAPEAAIWTPFDVFVRVIFEPADSAAWKAWAVTEAAMTLAPRLPAEMLAAGIFVRPAPEPKKTEAVDVPFV
jgi:hypothetical protein